MTTTEHHTHRRGLRDSPEYRQAITDLVEAHTAYRKAINEAFDVLEPEKHFLPDLIPIIEHHEPVIKQLVDQAILIGMQRRVP